MSIRTLKSQLRQSLIARIRALDPLARAREEALLRTRLSALPRFAEARTVLLFASAFAEEVDTRSWLRLVLDNGQRLVCPRVRPDRQGLELCRITDPRTDLVAGFRSIPEPAPACALVSPQAIDWALVPGLAFDRAGYRLGRGAGHYDRLLPTLRPGVPSFALILRDQWVDSVPREPHDQPLTGVADASGRIWPGHPPCDQ